MDITPTDFLKTSTQTAEHFGFRTINALKKNPVCKKCTHKIEHRATANDRKQDSLSGMLTAGVGAFIDARLNAIEEPVLFYNTEQVPRSGEVAVTLHIFGVEKSIAEVILIQTARAIMVDLGFSDYCVRINSLGDKDSTNRYIRELTNFLKKRLDEMPSATRELMKDHAFDALMHLIEKKHELAHKAPSPLEYLTDRSRKHFREIIEYLDMSDTPYEIDPKLIGHHHCYSDALFAIDLLENDGSEVAHPPLFIRGGRYDEFVDRYTSEPIPAAGVVIVLREKKAPQRTPRVPKGSAPSIYVVQLGFGPKIKTLMLVDDLRKAGVPVCHNLACDSLSTQLRDAEARGVKYTVIMGQKEYVERSVILRDMEARSQETVSLDSLVGRLRRMSKVAVNV